MPWMVSRTMVPKNTTSHLASRKRAAAEVKSVSVGLCLVSAVSFMPWTLSWSATPSVTSRPKSVSCASVQIAFLPRFSAKYFTAARAPS